MTAISQDNGDGGSPDLEIALAEIVKRLADSEKPERFQQAVDQALITLSLRYSVGVTPVVALKARLNGPSD